MAFDILIKNGRVADGSGAPAVAADVGIGDGKIQAVGRLDGEAARVIDASGKIVAPGFIDIHSHSEFILPLEKAPEILAPFIQQGITTLVTGNCGYSPAPVNPKTLDLMKSYTMFLKGEELSWEWTGFGEFLNYLERQGLCMNMVPMVSHGAARIHQVGFEGRPVTRDEMETMKRLVRQSLEEGAHGLSTGLLYAPGIFAPPDEIVELASTLKGYDAIYTSHIRGSSETLTSAAKEVIRVGEANGIRCQHSHIEAFGSYHWPKIDTILRLHEDARARGVDTGFDVIPYIAANTTLLAIFPPWALAGGVDALLQRLRDPEVRRDIRQSIEEDLPGWPCWLEGGWPHNLVEATGWDNIWVIWVESEKNKHLEGKSVPEIADAQGKDPFDAAFDLVLDEQGHAMALYFGVSGDLTTEEGLEKLMAHPLGAVETDAIITGKGVPHPAGYGAFPRTLGHFVRNRKLFSLEEAVRKCTSIAAERFNLKHRGFVREGMFADVTIFDPETVDDTTTYSEPAGAPRGIEHVLINGEVVVDAGQYHPEKLAGQVIRRGASNA
jgi:N-acyl-D-amino-acid deacylase